MDIYKLIPIESEKSNNQWRASSHQEDILVRTVSRSEARFLAKLSTSPGGEMHRLWQNTDDLLSPWLSEGLVVCEKYDGLEFSVEGEEEILKPNNLNTMLEKNYQIRKILRTLHEQDPAKALQGSDIGYLDGTFQSLADAKKAITADIQKLGNTYKYLVARSRGGRNIIVYEE